MPVLSVIVPFHNVAKYLGPCLDSLTAQRFRDCSEAVHAALRDEDREALVRIFSAASRWRNRLA